METDTVTIELPASLVIRLQAMATKKRIDVVELLNRLLGAVAAVETDLEPTTAAFRHILARSVDLGVSDLAEQHDHYVYGTEKR